MIEIIFMGFNSDSTFFDISYDSVQVFPTILIFTLDSKL